MLVKDLIQNLLKLKKGGADCFLQIDSEEYDRTLTVDLQDLFLNERGECIFYGELLEELYPNEYEKNTY